MEFAVDIVDPSARDNSESGHLDVRVRKVPTVTKEKSSQHNSGSGTGAHETSKEAASFSLLEHDQNVDNEQKEGGDYASEHMPECLTLRVDKLLYFRHAMEDEDRVLRTMHRKWLESRLSYIMDEDLVDTREEGKNMAFADLKNELIRRRKVHNEWRNLSSKKARRDAWHKFVEETAEDERRYWKTVNEIMLEDVAHRWLQIKMSDTSANNQKSSSASFTIDLQKPSSKRREDKRPNHKMGFYSKVDGTKTAESSKSGVIEGKEVSLGLAGFEKRKEQFRQTNSKLHSDLSNFVTPARKEAEKSSTSASRLVDQACLTQEEIEAKRQQEYIRLQYLRRLENMSDEECFTDFLCSVNQSRQETKFAKHGIGWRELPTLTDQKLLEILNMRNMLARRRFLQAIIERFGEEKVKRAQAGETSDSESNELEEAEKKTLTEDDGSGFGGGKEDKDDDNESDVGSEIFDYDSDLYRE